MRERVLDDEHARRPRLDDTASRANPPPGRFGQRDSEVATPARRGRVFRKAPVRRRRDELDRRVRRARGEVRERAVRASVPPRRSGRPTAPPRPRGSFLFSLPPARERGRGARSGEAAHGARRRTTCRRAARKRRYGRVPNPAFMTTTCLTPSRAEAHSRRITSSIARCLTADAATPRRPARAPGRSRSPRAAGLVHARDGRGRAQGRRRRTSLSEGHAHRRAPSWAPVWSPNAFTPREAALARRDAPIGMYVNVVRIKPLRDDLDAGDSE